MVLCFFVVVLMQMLAYRMHKAYNVWYNNPFLLLNGICLFESISRHDKAPCPKWVFLLAKYSFAIYLIHMPIISPVIKAMAAYPLPDFLKVIFGIIIVGVLSFLIAVGICKIPKVGKYIIYIK